MGPGAGKGLQDGVMEVPEINNVIGSGLPKPTVAAVRGQALPEEMPHLTQAGPPFPWTPTVSAVVPPAFPTQ